MEMKEHIEIIINNTFATLKDVYENQKEGYIYNPNSISSRLIFPQYSNSKKYRNGETRLSEQELRFIFVEQFNKYLDKYNKDKPESERLNWFYSVETPTEYKYIFTEDGEKSKKPRKANKDEKGQSAMVDFAIHSGNKFERLALVEFKALNPETLCFTKDFAKLEAESVENTYFVMYVKSHNVRTIESLKCKVSTNIGKTKFYCYDLESGLRIDTEIV